MNLTDLMPYNNNSGEKHYHKSPQGLQKPITRSWRPQAIIILDLRPFSKAGILYCTRMAHPCCSLTRVSNGNDSKGGWLKWFHRDRLEHKPVIGKLQKTKLYLNFIRIGKKRETMYWNCLLGWREAL